MRLLIDTHLALWWESKHPKLSQAAIDLIRSDAEAVFVSRASLWEIAIKVSLGRLKVDIPAFAENLEIHGFQWLDLKNSHVIAVAGLPSFEDHRDPFDRLLVAQSRVEPLLLVTADRALERYGPTVRMV